MKNFKFKINSNEYEVAINEVIENIAHIQVNGKDYTVELEKKADKPEPIVRKPKVQAVKNEPVQPKSQTSSASIKSVLSPLPGLILDVKVKEGDKLAKGAIVLVMEAMKMENNIATEFEGVVSSIKVKNGQSVLQNEVLIEIQ
ncbi:MAG TPA: acetyl-CoA carboxylase biotin carboxyl carrier protein subunit [Bacteroidales bacterium]|nr:acetyl-CoA carboxylase biotin carboxyl carrier protein subunit [Bacteroidales bacterium]